MENNITNITVLENFILENDLMFNDTGSGLNSDCTILSGFANFEGYHDSSDPIQAVKNIRPDATVFEDELERVFHYAALKNYGKWWESEEAEKMYKF